MWIATYRRETCNADCDVPPERFGLSEDRGNLGPASVAGGLHAEAPFFTTMAITVKAETTSNIRGKSITGANTTSG